ncbi:MAG: NYN domain-containing protein [Betaproteobacteria bacterium]|nr:NYN domain-containing protein [Betaproteobacteria bacterium]
MKNDSRPSNPRKEQTPLRSGRCIALIDSNYMSWLMRPNSQAGAEPEAYNRLALIPSLVQALKQASLALDVQRVYWYTDTPDNLFPQDQILRLLDSTAGEPSEVVLQAMSADITRLAERHACEHLLIASDDDRLTGVIDEAQLHGVNVYLLADESARHMDQLVNEDPAWCRLLGQADRRVLMLPQAARELTAQPRSAVPAIDPEEVRVKLQEVVDLWWNDEPEDLREDLRDELRGSQGLPQEVDRHMLLRVRRALDRPLSFPEKKMLREMVRNKVLGLTAEDMQA